MEDYKKKYEIAIKQAKEELKACGSLDCDAARQIFRFFPELKESEDERIRKDIIAFIESTPKAKNYHPIWIAWLEKQGEQKPVEWTELTWKDIVELEGIINNVHYDFSAGIGQESFGKEVLERFRNKKDDVEVDACEQKSAWSEEDEYLYTWCMSAIQTRYNDGLFTTGEYRQTRDWLKSLKERMKGE